MPGILAERPLCHGCVGKQLAALRGVPREAWRLGIMDADTYQRAADVRAPKGEGLTPAAG